MEDTIAGIAGNVLDDDVDEDICRICRCAGEPGNPLRHPCVCRGTIKYIHQDCLLLWLKRRNISHCEVLLIFYFSKFVLVILRLRRIIILYLFVELFAGL